MPYKLDLLGEQVIYERLYGEVSIEQVEQLFNEVSDHYKTIDGAATYWIIHIQPDISLPRNLGRLSKLSLDVLTRHKWAKVCVVGTYESQYVRLAVTSIFQMFGSGYRFFDELGEAFDYLKDIDPDLAELRQQFQDVYGTDV
jgi:hypothetical protein